MQSNLCYKQVSQLSKGTRSSLRDVFKKGGIITGGLVDPSDRWWVSNQTGTLDGAQDTASNVKHAKAGVTTTAEGARREEFAGAYGDEWAGRDTKQSTIERREGFAAAYGDEHNGLDVKESTEERREGFAGAYGDEWAGRDTKDNLGPGLVPNAAAAAGQGFEGWYSNANPEHNGLDVKESTEERPEGFKVNHN